MDGVLLPENASGSESDVSSVSRNLPDDEVKRWLFSREEIEENSPSRRDGIDLKKETELRISYCEFLQALGERFEVEQVTIDTAIVLCHRFFSRQSHAKNDRLTIATCCMLLAGKVEETQLHSEDCIAESYEIRHKKKLSATQREAVYEQEQELVFTGETLVLSTLNFDLSVYHPYEPLANAIKKYTVEEAKPQLSKLTLGFVKYCLKTTIYLQYKPDHIAAAAIFFAAQYLELEKQSYEWLLREEFDVTASQIADISDQMSELYKIISGKDAVQQPVSRDMASTDKCSTSSDIEEGPKKVNLSPSEDHSDQYGSKPEGIGEKNSESEGGENQNDHCVPATTVETSDDVEVSQLKDLEPHQEEVKSEPEKDEESFD